ncbi:MAG: flotillin family protein [Sandaracinaceae bacterium]|nr:flotillin family protein [Sandaracinaceae bacterium]
MRNLLFIARPNEALIFSGQRYTAPDGQVVGYKVVRQGRRALKIPIIERIDRMDMTLIPVDVVVQNAYSKGNIPLMIHAIANVKIHSDDRMIGNAIERFLGKPTGEIQLVAQQTLEGALREVLAQLTPEEVNEDRLKFAERLLQTAEDDLDKLGLQLDTLKIQSVSDDTGYLDSIGRPAIAQALRDAENAENQAMQETAQAQAEATQLAEVSKAEAQLVVQQKQNELRRVQAELEGEAAAVEREAEAAAKTARAEAEKELQEIRARLENLRLQAEVIIPAEFARQARAIEAIGRAAPTKENGEAAVEVLRMMTDAWKSMGNQARELYVIQHLEDIVGTVVDQLDNIEIDEVNVLDQGDGQGLSSYAATYPKMVAEVMNALKETTGVDVTGILKGEENSGQTRRASVMPPRGV